MCFFLSLILCESSIWASLSQELRRDALIEIDELFAKVLPWNDRTIEAISREFFWEPIPFMQMFVQEHGYFSATKPLIGVVTDDLQDVRKAEELFLHLPPLSEELFSFARGEILSKVLAYRELTKGIVLAIPTRIDRKVQTIDYIVDEILDLWMGMPAFGLLPLYGKGAPILLFRGTDCSFLSTKSTASLLSDLDMTGIGFSVFCSAQSRIKTWLDKVPHPVQTLGFSLGGVLATYTILFFQDIDFVDSLAFNAPGLLSSLLPKTTSSITNYLTQGDFVSKLGTLISPSIALFLCNDLTPIKAHTTFFLGESAFLWQDVLLEEENKHRLFVNEH